MQDIRGRIGKGLLKVGDQVGSHHQLAAEYGVSLITVKRAVSGLVNEGLLYTRVGKGSFVARRGNGGSDSPQGSTIGLVLRDLHSPFFSMIVQEVEKAAYSAGFNVLLSNSGGVQAKEDAQIQHFRRIGVQGLIIASMQHLYHATPLIRRLMREHFPLVMVSYNDDADIPFVGTDHERGGFMATEHLIATGYRRIAYVNGEKGNLVGELRKRGYQEALVQYGHDVDPKLQFRLPRRGGVHDYQSGVEVGRQILKIRRKPDAVFVYNDLAALGLKDTLLTQGLRIPDHMAIIGFDDIERGRYTQVPLSTIRQPVEEIGLKAVETLVAKLQSRPTPTRVILPPTLVVRASSVRSGQVTPSGERHRPPQPSTSVQLLPSKAS
jgi:DNA-binding LacI/PurR family transcriptional regulator